MEAYANRIWNKILARALERLGRKLLPKRGIHYNSLYDINYQGRSTFVVGTIAGAFGGTLPTD